MLSVLTTLLGFIATGVGLLFTWSANRRSQYERVLAATADLTTGHVAVSRHKVGLFLEPKKKAASAQSIDLSPELASDYFDVLWAFDRLYGLYTSLRPTGPLRQFSRPCQLLLTSARSSIEVWCDYAGVVTGVDADISNRSVRELKRLVDRLDRKPTWWWRPRPPHGERGR